MERGTLFGLFAYFVFVGIIYFSILAQILFLPIIPGIPLIFMVFQYMAFYILYYLSYPVTILLLGVFPPIVISELSISYALYMSSLGASACLSFLGAAFAFPIYGAIIGWIYEKFIR